MEKEEKIKKQKIIAKYRDDSLLKRIIDEYLVRFGGQLTREEIESILKNNRFEGLYVLNEQDYLKVNDGENEINTAGTYIPALRVITLREKFASNNIMIGCHEFTHALLNGKLSYIVRTSKGDVSYGIGLEEGVATAVERRKGVVNVCQNDPYHFGYDRNNMIMMELDILYEKSKYRKYDSILVEAIKSPDKFFNLVYRIVLDNMKGIFRKSKENKKPLEEIKMFALKISFIILQSADMLIEFTGPSVVKEDREIVLTTFGFTKLINACLLSYNDKNIRNGVINPNYLGAFLRGDFKLLELSNEDRLVQILFESDETYYNRLIRYLEKISMEYVLMVDQIGKENETKGIGLSHK